MLPLLAVLLIGLAADSLGLPIDGRIVNGTDANEGEIPYIVSLRRQNRHTCGGSIISERYILTAAHCVVSSKASDMSIQYGVTSITSTANAPNVIPVEKIIYHKDYVSGKGYVNDVAVLKLTKPIPLGPLVRPIKLAPAFNATPENAPATLSGWGLPYTDGSVMEKLQTVSLVVFTDEECETIHKSTGPTSRNLHVCAGIPGGGQGQCNGDSGGPLVVNGVQVGIVSWSVKPCARPGYPGVFTKVSSQIGWIQENTGNAAQV